MHIAQILIFAFSVRFTLRKILKSGIDIQQKTPAFHL